MGIGRGIPFVDVDAVADAHESIGEGTEGVLETEPTDVREQLERMRRAHGCHHVGVFDAALQVVEPPIPLHVIRRP